MHCKPAFYAKNTKKAVGKTLSRRLTLYNCLKTCQSFTFFFFIFDSFPMRLSDVTTYVYLSMPLS